MRVFVTKSFGRFQRKEKISDAALNEAIARAERGQIDATLGRHLIKQRIGRPGKAGLVDIAQSLPTAQATRPFLSSGSPRTSEKISMRRMNMSWRQRERGCLHSVRRPFGMRLRQEN